MRHEAALLLEQANEDMISVQANIDTRRWYVSVFLSHQAAEKALKALYITERADLSRTHDLVELCAELGAPDQVMAGARRLNRHYTATRYPDAANGTPAKQYDEAQAREYLAVSQEIIQWVNSRIA